LLFHGSFLLQCDLALIENILPMPSKQPAYRRHRPHLKFLTNLELPPKKIKEALKKTWGATQPLPAVPFDQVDRLVREKYATEEWTFRV
jgi:lipoate-protein ligase A